MHTENNKKKKKANRSLAFYSQLYFAAPRFISHSTKAFPTDEQILKEGMLRLGLKVLLVALLIPLLLSLYEAFHDDPSQHRPDRASFIVLPGYASSEKADGRQDDKSLSTGLHSGTKGTKSCPPSCFRPNPVCGVNGVTYWCGAADAECAGVQVEHVGFCDIGSQGTGGKGVLAIQSLLLVHMMWLVMAGFLVLLGIP